jgi:hypothetical protein
MILGAADQPRSQAHVFQDELYPSQKSKPVLFTDQYNF